MSGAEHRGLGGWVTENGGVPVDEESVSLYDEDQGRTGDGRDGTCAADAMLQGFLTMLGEVLGRLDRRLDAVQGALAGEPVQMTLTPPPPDAAAPAVLAGLGLLEQRLDRLEAEREEQRREDGATLLAVFDRLEDRLDRLDPEEGPDGDEPGAVAEALQRLEERLERLEAAGGTSDGVGAALSRLDELATAVDTIGYGLASLADIVTSPRPAGEAVPATLDDRLVSLAAGVETVGGRLDEVRQNLAALAAAVDSAGRERGSGQGPSSLGRRAGEIGRRLAADLAVRTREPLRGPRPSS